MFQVVDVLGKEEGLHEFKLEAVGELRVQSRSLWRERSTEPRSLWREAVSRRYST